LPLSVTLPARAWKVRQDREITLAIIHEHLGHLAREMADATHALAHIALSVNRIRTLARRWKPALASPSRISRRTRCRVGPSSPPDQSA
jgi:oligoribonuclease (3'-5' exoribonuclease)